MLKLMSLQGLRKLISEKRWERNVLAGREAVIHDLIPLNLPLFLLVNDKFIVINLKDRSRKLTERILQHFSAGEKKKKKPHVNFIK